MKKMVSIARALKEKNRVAVVECCPVSVDTALHGDG